MLCKQYLLEFTLERASFSQLWGMLSTEEGLSRWLDGQVYTSGDITFFQWSKDDIERVQMYVNLEKRTVSFQWLDRSGSFSFLVTDSELTKDLTLTISGVCEAEDLDAELMLWHKQVEHLLYLIGLHA